MKKLLFLFTMLALFVACSDDDDKDNESPIKGLEIPKFENPVKPGEAITIKGLPKQVKSGSDKSFLRQPGTVMLKLLLPKLIQRGLLLLLRKFMVIKLCF